MATPKTPIESPLAATRAMLNGASSNPDEDDFFAKRRQVQRVSSREEASSTPAERNEYRAEAKPEAQPEPKPAKRKSVKQTIDVSAETHDMLERVSYWKRTPKAVLMNRALNQYLSQLPEAQEPIPPQQEE